MANLKLEKDCIAVCDDSKRWKQPFSLGLVLAIEGGKVKVRILRSPKHEKNTFVPFSSHCVRAVGPPSDEPIEDRLADVVLRLDGEVEELRKAG